jgi:hypothetical protein
MNSETEEHDAMTARIGSCQIKQIYGIMSCRVRTLWTWYSHGKEENEFIR